MDAITHFLVGRLLAVPFAGPLGVLATVFAVLPDIDTVGWFVPGLRGRIRHRGASHSIVFGVGASLLAATLFARMGWSSFGLAFVVALAGFATHVALDVMNWGCILLWPFSQKPVEHTVHAGFAWSAVLSLLGVVALESARAFAPALAPLLALAMGLYFVAHFALRLALRELAERRSAGRRVVPTGNPFVWLAVVRVRVEGAEDRVEAERVRVLTSA